MRTRLALLVILLAPAVVVPSLRAVTAKSKNIASYKIDAQLKLDERHRPSIVDGKSRLIWLNDSTDTIPDLQFHLYLNAFKDDKSSFVRESGGQLRGDKLAPGELGSIELKEMKLGTEDLLKTAEFIQPDDNNSDDQNGTARDTGASHQTGETITLDIVFTSRLPRSSPERGTGLICNDWSMFPKIGVWESAGQRRRDKAGWNCHQFHADSDSMQTLAPMTLISPSVNLSRKGGRHR
jgi:hypothetical protein